MRADELTFKFFILEKFVSVDATVVFFLSSDQYNCSPYDFMKKCAFFQNFISYSIATIYVGGVSLLYAGTECRFRANCMLTAFSRWLPSVVRFMFDNMNGLLAFA